MAIELGSDLDDYELIEIFFPNASDLDQEKLAKIILTCQLMDDPLGVFYLSSIDRFFIVTFEGGGHERDSSGDMYALHRRKRII